MRLRIHHGASEIGGNCIELEADGRRLLLDLGLPLDQPAIVPLVQGLLEPNHTLLGVVLSHPHLDHYGLLPSVRADLPVWLGDGAIRLLQAAAPFTAGSRLPQTLRPLFDRQTFQLGPFVVTPYLMDHSAYDAYSLLVEAGGRRLFYTGDFRGHGRKASVFERFLAKPPADIDVLLMEGTTIGRSELSRSEAELEAAFAEALRATSGLALVAFSGQNIDRFVSIFSAAVKSQRIFVLDAYLANLIAALLHGPDPPALPDPANSNALRVYLPTSQRRTIVRSGRFELIDRFRPARIYLDRIAEAPQRYVMMLRASMARELEALPLAGGRLIYSLWPGYLERDRLDLRAWAHTHGLDFEIIHSSGHANTADLKRMVEALQPGHLTPIHTVEPQAYRQFGAPVAFAPNGQWMAV